MATTKKTPARKAHVADAGVRSERMAKAHVTVGFWRGSEVEAPIGTFERSERMGHFKLLGPDELDEKALVVMVKSAVRLNREKGSPAMGRGA